jgi:hypothetical protein
MLIAADAEDEEPGAEGGSARDALLLLLNAAGVDCAFRLPAMPAPGRFETLLTTADAEIQADGSVRVPARSLALLAFRAGA